MPAASGLWYVLNYHSGILRASHVPQHRVKTRAAIRTAISSCDVFNLTRYFIKRHGETSRAPNMIELRPFSAFQRSLQCLQILNMRNTHKAHINCPQCSLMPRHRFRAFFTFSAINVTFST